MEKIFIGSVKEKISTYGNFLQLGFKLEDLVKMESFVNENGWINISIFTSQKTGNPYMQITIPNQQQAPKQKEIPKEQEHIIPGEEEMF